MRYFKSGPVRGIFILTLFSINTIGCATSIFLLGVLKLVIPIGRLHKLCNKIINKLGDFWIIFNNFLVPGINRTIVNIEGIQGLKRDEWYLVISNHQSASDIPVLYHVFHRKIPFLRFFIKHSLFWVPFMGGALWAADFPFMKRYSKGHLKRHPHLKRKDLETAKKACEKFMKMPVALTIFLEGARHKNKKHLEQQSPFTHLLKPRAGGMASVLAAMGRQLHYILNVTIIYPKGKKGLWELCCGYIKEIKVIVETIPIKEDFIGDYYQDMEFRKRFQDRINALWKEKDQLISSVLENAKPTQTSFSFHSTQDKN